MRQLEIIVVGIAALLNLGMILVGISTLLTGSYISDGIASGESLLAPNLFLLLYASVNGFAIYLLGRRYL